MERCNIKKNNSKVIMLKKLDKYIITQFLSSFFIGTALFIVIAIIFDIKEKLEDFLGGEASLYMIVTDYYLSFIPYITMLLAPLFIYLAVVFTTSRLAMRTEIIAILNGGVSYYRFLRPFFLAATFLVIPSYGIYHYILPIANKKRLDFENAYIRNPFFNTNRNINIQLNKNSIAYFQSFNTKDTIGYKFVLEKFTADGKLLSKLSAPRIKWKSKTSSWYIPKYKVRIFNSDNETIIRRSKLDTILEIKPGDFGRKADLLENLTTPELEQYIEEAISKGSELVPSYQVSLYERSAKAFVIYLLVLIGVSMSSRKSRGGTGKHIVLGILISVGYFFLSRVTIMYSMNAGFNPMLGAWLPNILYFAIAMVSLRFAPK